MYYYYSFTVSILRYKIISKNQQIDLYIWFDYNLDLGVKTIFSMKEMKVTVSRPMLKDKTAVFKLTDGRYHPGNLELEHSHLLVSRLLLHTLEMG